MRDTAVSVNMFLGKACCHRGYGFLKYRMSGLARSLLRLIFYVLSHQLSSFVVAYLFYCFLPPHSTIFHCQSLISISFPAFPASSFCWLCFNSADSLLPPLFGVCPKKLLALCCLLLFFSVDFRNNCFLFKKKIQTLAR